MKKYRCENCGDWFECLDGENFSLCEECDQEERDRQATCLECGGWIEEERDIQLCNACVDKFDLDQLWREHDANKLDALDFNENKKMREKYRKTKPRWDDGV